MCACRRAVGSCRAESRTTPLARLKKKLDAGTSRPLPTMRRAADRKKGSSSTLRRRTSETAPFERSRADSPDGSRVRRTLSTLTLSDGTHERDVISKLRIVPPPISRKSPWPAESQRPSIDFAVGPGYSGGAFGATGSWPKAYKEMAQKPARCMNLRIWPVDGLLTRAFPTSVG